MLHVSPVQWVLLDRTSGARGKDSGLLKAGQKTSRARRPAPGAEALGNAGGEECSERVRVPCRHYAPCTAVQFVRQCAAGWQFQAARNRFQLSGGGPFRRPQCDARRKTLAAFTLRTPRSLTLSASTPSTMATIMVRLHSLFSHLFRFSVHCFCGRAQQAG